MPNKISSPRSSLLLGKAATLTMGLISACSDESAFTDTQTADAIRRQIDGSIFQTLSGDTTEADASAFPQDATPSDTSELCIQDWKKEREMDPCSIVDEEYGAPVMKEFDIVMTTLAELFEDTGNPPYIGKDKGGSIYIKDSKLKEVIFQQSPNSNWTIYAHGEKLGMKGSVIVSGNTLSGEPWYISTLDSAQDPHCEEIVKGFSIGINISEGGEFGVYRQTIRRSVHENPKDSLCEQDKISKIDGECSAEYPYPNIINTCNKLDDSTWHLYSYSNQVYPLKQVKQDLATRFDSMAKIIVENDIDPSLVAWFKPFVKK